MLGQLIPLPGIQLDPLQIPHNGGDGVNTTTYAYDALNQLTRENNQAAGKTWVWTYDNGGNITSKTEYDYTTGTLGTALDTITYTYGDDDWGDLLTAYDGVTITHDGIGNPLNNGTWSYSWNGRQLESMTSGSTTWSYKYDSDGLRTERTNGSTTYKYTYSGSSLVHMSVGSNTLRFAYDSNGAPMGVNYNGTNYYYATNLQGDVIAILDSSGTKVVEYTYDAWGKLLSTSGTMSSTLGVHNPLRYRAYVYDHETQLYYLQSRYYNPKIGRFLNADALISTGQGILRNNMFAYCGNNPVVFSDPSGQYYTPGQIHDFVVKDICKDDPNKTGEKTYMKYKKALKKRKSISWYGFCDIYDRNTNEIWEVKRFGGGTSCTIAAATEQLMNYITNGEFVYWNETGKPLHPGGTYSSIDASWFSVPDNDSHGTYVIGYWDAGAGVIFYDYYYVPDLDEMVYIGAATIIGIGVFYMMTVSGGAGAGALIPVATALG